MRDKELRDLLELEREFSTVSTKADRNVRTLSVRIGDLEHQGVVLIKDLREYKTSLQIAVAELLVAVQRQDKTIKRLLEYLDIEEEQTPAAPAVIKLVKKKGKKK